MILSVPEARRLAEASMITAGHTRAEAAIIADHLVDCELRGLSFGGLPRALSIAERIREARTPRRPINVIRDTPVSATLDGGDQVGYLVARRATEIAIKKARTSGVAVVGAYETWYTGMFSYYLEILVKEGFVGMIAGSGGHIVAPEGGTERRFGTNPIAFGFPSDDVPVIWDIGTASVMLGEVLMKMRLGEPLSEGIAYDNAGNPTQDPIAALQGAFKVWGGHKGSGLAMVVQLLGMMCGASAAPDGLRDCGFFLLAIDPSILTSADEFRQRVSAYVDSIRATRPVDESRPVRVPFERSVAERARRFSENRIEVADAVYDALVKMSGYVPAH
ncbi:Ldh family oxidoreductase (plasmid) [Paraburkholderia sp. D15]|uniref:Ldh family oxidoreductase n=1 Tax=Paraburkholderia sp. D15 TaxID=2880218 RepID=UPI00247B1ACC|nr:Ldh family oxidoreductase [Paraburkholderia sp. D15]WGS55275.1 Ldh family oxidoreductase [Paraburkholderia sp. D15]